MDPELAFHLDRAGRRPVVDRPRVGHRRSSPRPTLLGGDQVALDVEQGRPVGRRGRGVPRCRPGRGATTRCSRRSRGRGGRSTSATCSGSSSRTSASTRRSRLRCIRSALPIQTCGSPSLANKKIRECSRKRPRMLRTRMVSDSPGTPGAQRADAAHPDVDGNARRGRAVQRVDDLLVDDRVDLDPDRGPADRPVVRRPPRRSARPGRSGPSAARRAGACSRCSSSSRTAR